MYAKMTASDLMFSETPDKITSEMSVTVLGDLGNFCDTGNAGSDVSVLYSSGNIFRRESSVAPYESWTGQPLQVMGNIDTIKNVTLLVWTNERPVFRSRDQY